MKTTVSILVMLLFSWSILAQTKKATPTGDLYQQALQLYVEDNFKDCITKLDRAEKLSPKANAKILYLKTKALYQLCRIDKLYNASFEKAFTAFMGSAVQQSYAPAKIEEIARLQPQIQLIQAENALKAQRLLAIRDSLQADSIRREAVTVLYEKAHQLYEESKWAQCVAVLKDMDTLLTQPDARVVYLRIKSLYPLLTESAVYQTDIREALQLFSESGNKLTLSVEQRQEILTLQQNVTEKLRKLEAEKEKQVEITRIYQLAEQLYEIDSLSACIKQLEQLEAFVDTPDVKIIYLKIKALYPLYTTDEKYKAALDLALPQFFQLTDAQSYPARKVAEVKQIQEKLSIR